MAPVKFHPSAREELEIPLEHFDQLGAKLGSDFSMNTSNAVRKSQKRRVFFASAITEHAG